MDIRIKPLDKVHYILANEMVLKANIIVYTMVKYFFTDTGDAVAIWNSSTEEAKVNYMINALSVYGLDTADTMLFLRNSYVVDEDNVEINVIDEDTGNIVLKLSHWSILDTVIKNIISIVDNDRYKSKYLCNKAMIHNGKIPIDKLMSAAFANPDKSFNEILNNEVAKLN